MRGVSPDPRPSPSYPSRFPPEREVPPTLGASASGRRDQVAGRPTCRDSSSGRTSPGPLRWPARASLHPASPGSPQRSESRLSSRCRRGRLGSASVTERPAAGSQPGVNTRDHPSHQCTGMSRGGTSVGPPAGSVATLANPKVAHRPSVTCQYPDARRLYPIAPMLVTHHPSQFPLAQGLSVLQDEVSGVLLFCSDPEVNPRPPGREFTDRHRDNPHCIQARHTRCGGPRQLAPGQAQDLARLSRLDPVGQSRAVTLTSSSRGCVWTASG